MNNWDDLYKQGRHCSVWPFSDLVSMCKRHCPELKGKRVLELGCGMGANIPFFLAEGGDYEGVECSEFAVAALRTIWPQVKIHDSDFCDWIPPSAWDLIVDRASVPHNSLSCMRSAIALCHKELRYGGIYIGVDWFAKDHWGAYCKDEAFPGCGEVSFTSRSEIYNLFKGWDVSYIERKELTSNSRTAVTHNFVAIRKESCEYCDGSGYKNEDDECKVCSGRGWV